MPPTGDLAHYPGMYHDWESNQWPFGSQAGTQSTELHQPGQDFFFNGYLRYSCVVVMVDYLFNYEYYFNIVLWVGHL